MAFAVYLTESAARDLEDIYEYVARHDSARKAEALLTKVAKVLASLADSPERGSHSRELAALGIQEYRQIPLKPYRIIYRIAGKQVYVMLIADGRRDMQSLLERRLLESP